MCIRDSTLLMSHKYYKRFQTSKVTFKLSQGHRLSCHSIAIYDFLFVFHRNYVNLAPFPRYYRMSQNLDITWLWPRPSKIQFVIAMLNCYLENQCTKLKVSSFSHSGYILGGTKNLNRSFNHNHTPFEGDFYSFDKTWYSPHGYKIWQL